MDRFVRKTALHFKLTENFDPHTATMILAPTLGKAVEGSKCFGNFNIKDEIITAFP